MKKITKLTCTFAVMAAALFALTGCSNPDPSAETSKPAVAYVISNTANSKSGRASRSFSISTITWGSADSRLFRKFK